MAHLLVVYHATERDERRGAVLVHLAVLRSNTAIWQSAHAEHRESRILL